MFDVYSGNVYKGRAQVQTVHDEYCSAPVTLPIKGTQMPTQGDSVTTQL